jgi:hypothetical protein
VNGRAAVSLILAVCLRAQAPLEFNGKPIRLPFECTQADSEGGGLSCSEEHPCQVYLELANVEAVGNKVFLTGNLHTPEATLYSILLASEDSGKTWNEPVARLHSSGLDQIQFFDFENGWISGANLLGAPRDPFLLITSDGGKTWHQRPIFEESRVASIERFWFESAQIGTLLIDARLDNKRHELYETRTGGEGWAMRQSSVKPIPFPHAFDSSAAAWRVRPDAATRSNVIEKSLGDPSSGNHWHTMASFLVDAGACKQ